MPVLYLSVAAESATAGTAADVERLRGDKSIQISGVTSGTFVLATLRIQGSNNNLNWYQIGDDIVADGLYTVTVPVAWLRVYTADYTSGTPTAVLVGHTQT